MASSPSQREPHLPSTGSPTLPSKVTAVHTLYIVSGGVWDCPTAELSDFQLVDCCHHGLFSSPLFMVKSTNPKVKSLNLNHL